MIFITNSLKNEIFVINILKILKLAVNLHRNTKKCD